MFRRTEAISLWSGKPAPHRSNPTVSPRPGENTRSRWFPEEGSGWWRTFFFRLGRPQGVVEVGVRRIEAYGSLRQPTRPGERTGWRWRTGGRRQASATWPWKPRRVLETDLQHLGKPLQGAAGECPSPETSAGAPERRLRRPGDRTPAAAGVVARQLPSAAARGARPDPAPNAVGGSQGPHP